MPRPLPVPTAETAPFWDGLRAHELRLLWCRRCERFEAPWASICSQCLEDTEWRPVSGRVTLDTWTVVHRALTPGFTPPYGVGSIVPAESTHVRLDTMLDPDDLDRLHVGMSGRLAFVDEPLGWTLHRFSPDAPEGRKPAATANQKGQ
jgi:uncharacterized protein